MVNDLTVTKEQDWWSNTQLAALQHMGVQDAPNADLAVFLHQCKRTGLDPFSRQVYMIGRRNKTRRQVNGQWQDVWETKWTIQTAIDGFRLIARRAADHNHEKFGEPETLWCGEDGVWRDVWLGKDHPSAAKVVVERGEGVFTGVALYDEYVGMRFDKATQSNVPNSMWASKPAVMLAKCAEALALRKAFPQDLSGLYTADEMDAVSDEPSQVVDAGSEPVVEAQVMADAGMHAELKALYPEWVKATGGSGRAFSDEIRRITGRQDAAPRNLTDTECEGVLQALRAQLTKTNQPTNDRKAKEDSHE